MMDQNKSKQQLFQELAKMRDGFDAGIGGKRAAAGRVGIEEKQNDAAGDH